MILKKLTLWIFLIYLSSLLISCSELTKNQNKTPTPLIIHSVTSIDSNVILSWENSTSMDFSNTQIYRCSENVMVHCGLYNEGSLKGEKIYEGKENNFIDTNLFAGNVYCYGFYSTNIYGIKSESSRSTTKCIFSTEEGPTNVFIKSWDTSIVISWENPKNLDYENTTIVKVIDDDLILCRSDGYFYKTLAGSNCGEIVYQGNLEIFIDNEVLFSNSYWYLLYSNDLSGNISEHHLLGEYHYNMKHYLLFSENFNLYGGSNHDIYLGCLGCHQTSAESICNINGQYGNQYSMNSIFNAYSDFGNQYSDKSPWNNNSSSKSVPIIFDDLSNSTIRYNPDYKNNYYEHHGFFTINTSRHDSMAASYLLLEIYNEQNGDLVKVQEEFCKIMESGYKSIL